MDIPAVRGSGIRVGYDAKLVFISITSSAEDDDDDDDDVVVQFGSRQRRRRRHRRHDAELVLLP